MITSFVLIKTKPGKGCEVCDEFIKIPEIKECYQLSCEYDILTKIDADNFNEMGQIIRKKIRFIQNVIDTKTMLGLKL
jgi:DNA-binding Lrp family transcriptional regulator